MKNIQVSVVLVRTIYPSNIGTTARAMSNMGIDRLVLIDKQCDVNGKAFQGAANGQSPLRNRVEYANWQEFYAKEGEGLRIALTARSGAERKVCELETYLQEIKLQPDFSLQPNKHVYLFFGPEDCGLSAEDMAMVHQACNITTYGNNSSLNLSQAVLLTLYCVRKHWNDFISENAVEIKSEPTISTEALYFPDQTLRMWLEALGFDISSKRVNAYTTLRRMLLQNVPSAKELSTLEAVLQQNIRKLAE